ncbi:hypothetical protein V8G54_001117 [Vigna mungo]|uniref:Uncharacterized protein n=1 Tax=Vigna mungo TaxID=3915 RepID=A0AAQ3P6P3_VIGMU
MQEIREIVQEIKDMLQELINGGRGSERSEKFVMKGKKEEKTGRNTVKDSLHNIKKGKKFSEEEYLANDEEKKEDIHGVVKLDKEGEELLRHGVKTVVSRSNRVEVRVSTGASTIAVTDPYPEIPDVIILADLASSNCHKGISNFHADSLLTSHLELLIVEEGKDGRKETSGMEAGQTVLERTVILVLYGDKPNVTYLKDSLNVVQNATQAAQHDDDDDEFAWSDQQALSFLASRMNKSRQGEGLASAAAIQIQKNSQGWKKRKELLIIRQRIIKVQVHVRGHWVRMQVVVSWFPSYDNKLMKMNHGYKLHYPNLEDKVVLQQHAMMGYNVYDRRKQIKK